MFKFDNEVDTCGVYRVGEMVVSIPKLIEVFGQPIPSDGYKVTSQWIFTDDSGRAFMLNDWKDTNLYDDCLPTIREFRSNEKALLMIRSRGHDPSDFISFIRQKTKEASDG